MSCYTEPKLMAAVLKTLAHLLPVYDVDPLRNISK